MEMILYGLKGPSTTNFCIRCKTTHEGKFGEFDTEKSCPIRDDMLEVDKDSKGSKIRKALFSTIPSANYYVPLLHVWLGIAVDVINIIKREVLLNDLEINIPGKKNYNLHC